jgi:S-DNA-T family DNA segregation ATPase FtsK/SpoIIIE
VAQRKSATAKKNQPKTPNRSKGQARAQASRPAPAHSRTARAPRRKSPSKSLPSLIPHLSAERKLDLVGIFLSLLGVMTLLSLISVNRGSVTGWWVNTIAQALGWGMYLLPLGLLVIGLWLVMRNVERLPLLSAERITGALVLYFNILAWMHLLAGGGRSLAEAGEGGGYLGYWLSQALVSALGLAGGVIALLAWSLIGLTLALDISIPEMFRWIAPLGGHIKALGQALAENLSSGRQDKENGARGYPPDFTPLAPGAAQAAGAFESPVAPAGEVPAPPFPEPPAAAWTLPAVETILDAGLPAKADEELDRERGRLIEDTLASFGAPAHVVEIHRGPTITQFGVEPDFIENRSGRTRVRVSKIVALADDLALALAAPRIRIQAPVPGRAYVGIEVPNTEISRVALRDVIESDAFQKARSPLRIALGKDVAGRPVTADLTVMPHLLIAGTTGSGKSVCVNSLLTCLLLNNTPDDLRLILVDPKRVELTGYNGIPHLMAPVVVEVERVVGALQWMMREMDSRYHKFAQAGARNIEDYNARLQARGEKKIPYLVVVIDELADLMMLAPDETERTITRLAQLARATGLHLVIATQRPSVDVITGLIKANFPARVAFAVASGVDSRVILDQPGAERLLGRGDMLFQAPDAPAPVRLQGVYVADSEIQRLVNYWRTLSAAAAVSPQPAGEAGAEDIPQGVPLKQGILFEEAAAEEDKDPILDDAIDLVRREGRASISMLQRRLRVGYTRAARIIDTLEDKGIISPAQPNSQVREVLDYGPAAPPKEE